MVQILNLYYASLSISPLLQLLTFIKIHQISYRVNSKVWKMLCWSEILIFCAGGSAIAELRRALKEYLSVLIGLTKKGSYRMSIFSSFLKWVVTCEWFSFINRVWSWRTNRFQVEKFRRWETSMAISKLILYYCFFNWIYSFFNMVKSNWQDSSISNTWFEVLSSVHLMAMLTLSDADSLMIPKDPSGSGFRVVSSGFVPIHKL